MLHVFSAFLILLQSLVHSAQANSVWPEPGVTPGIQEIYVPYSELSDRQRELLDTLSAERKFEGDGQAFWNKLGEENSVQRTFYYTTKAMEQRFVKNGESVLDQVESISDIAGSVKGAHSADQFNIEVKWKSPPQGYKKTKDLFKTKDYANRFSTDHPGETGIQEKQDGYKGLHLLFSNDSNSGHVHVDFRGTNWFEAMMTKLKLKFLIPKGMKKGHFEARNADIGAVGPEKENGVPISNYEWFMKTYNVPELMTYLDYPGQSPAITMAMDKNLPEAEGVVGEMTAPLAESVSGVAL